MSVGTRRWQSFPPSPKQGAPSAWRGLAVSPSHQYGTLLSTFIAAVISLCLEGPSQWTPRAHGVSLFLPLLLYCFHCLEILCPFSHAQPLCLGNHNPSWKTQLRCPLLQRASLRAPVLVATLPHPQSPLLDNSMSPLPHQTLCSLREDLVVSLSL